MLLVSSEGIHHGPRKPRETGRDRRPFAYLSPYEFVLLTTFRKSGVGVPTAMWFAHEQGKLYMVTGRTRGKPTPPYYELLTSTPAIFSSTVSSDV